MSPFVSEETTILRRPFRVVAAALLLGLIVPLMVMLPAQEANAAFYVHDTTVDVGDSPIAIAVSPDGSRVYTANINDASISVIDAATNTVIDTIAVGVAPSSVAVSPDGSRMYVTHLIGFSISVIDLITNHVIDTIPVGSFQVRAVTVSPDSSTVYTASTFDDLVSVLDATTNAVTATIPVGSMPVSVAVSPDGGTLYTANENGHSVSVVSTATNTVVGTIPVGARPSDVTLSPDGRTIYTANGFSRSVSVIDAATNEVTGTIPIDGVPMSVAVSPDSGTVFTANSSSNTVSVIDANTNTVVDTLAAGQFPWSVTMSPNGNTLYAANSSGNSVSVFTVVTPDPVAAPSALALDSQAWVSWEAPAASPHYTITGYTVHVHEGGSEIASWPAAAHSTGRLIPQLSNGAEYTFTVSASTTIGKSPQSPPSAAASPLGSPVPNALTATIGVGDRPASVAVSPDGSRVYTADSMSDSVSVIDAATNSKIGAIEVGEFAISVAVSPDGSRLYTANFFDDSVSVVDVATSTVIDTIAVDEYPIAVTASPDVRRVYAVSHQQHSVSVIDAATNTVADTIRVGTIPYSVAVSPDGGTLYTADSDDNSVTVVDTATNTVTDTIPVGEFPASVAISPDGDSVYTANFDDGTVSVIDTTTNTVAATISVGGEPTSVAVSPDSGTIFAANLDDNSVSVIDANTNAALATIPMGREPLSVAVSPSGDSVYVANGEDGSLSVLQHLAPVRVTFDTGGGSAIAPVTVDHGDTITAPADPALEGYAFTGWFTDAAATAPFDFDTPLTSDLTLYAGWQINAYTVSFDTGAGSAVAPVTVEHGDTVTAPTEPTRDGHAFTEWFTDTTGTEAFDFATPITSDLTLYAGWSSTTIASLVVHGSASATEGDTAGYTVEGFNAAGESLGDATALTVLTSDLAGDTVAGYDVTFGFDPEAIGGSSTRTLTATLHADSSITAELPVEVGSAARSIRLRAPTTADQGDTITVTVEALDTAGARLGDATAASIVTSSVATDQINGSTVRFVDASPHVLTATIPGAPGFTSAATVEVRPAEARPVKDRPETPVAVTGADAQGPLLAGLVLLATGAFALLITRDRRTNREPCEGRFNL